MPPPRSGRMRLVASRTLRVGKVWQIGVLAAIGFLIFLCVCWPVRSSVTIDPVYFLSIGDFGSGSQMQNLVAQQMSVAASEKEARFVVSLGDNVYPIGVSGIEDPLFHTVFEDVYTQESLQIPWLMSLGDHDHRGNISAQIDHSNSSSKWRLRAQYYLHSVPVGGSHKLDVVITDSVALEGAVGNGQQGDRRFFKDYDLTRVGEEAGKQHLKWLEETLNESTADWLIVVGHRPIVSCATRPRFPAEQRFSELMQGMMHKYNVDVYIHGHDHVGQHSDVEGVVHLGNGVGGYGNHAATPNNHTVWVDPHYSGFILHKVSPTSMDFDFVSSNGTVLHTVHIAQKWASRDMRRRRLL